MYLNERVVNPAYERSHVIPQPCASVVLPEMVETCEDWILTFPNIHSCMKNMVEYAWSVFTVDQSGRYLRSDSCPTISKADADGAIRTLSN